MGKIVVDDFGLSGVNVDKNPLELADSELTRGKNVISGPRTGQSSIGKRAGLLRFTASATAGTVLGGVDLPIADQSGAGMHILYIGRGATS